MMQQKETCLAQCLAYKNVFNKYEFPFLLLLGLGQFPYNRLLTNFC